MLKGAGSLGRVYAPGYMPSPNSRPQPMTDERCKPQPLCLQVRLVLWCSRVCPLQATTQDKADLA